MKKKLKKKLKNLTKYVCRADVLTVPRGRVFPPASPLPVMKASSLARLRGLRLHGLRCMASVCMASALTAATLRALVRGRWWGINIKLVSKKPRE